jgi:NAD(P)-dependent dehydrogenase (short-subunit alcohol dehydrogenase family)
VAQTKTATKKTNKQKTSSRSMKKSAAQAAAELGKDTVTIDRRASKQRRDAEEAAAETVAAPKLERRQKVSRRRQIDPTTCERDYTDQEVEFMNALDEYKRKSGRMFPTCSEVLEVINSLGYVKLAPGAACTAAMNASTASAKPMPTTELLDTCAGLLAEAACEI